MPDLRDRPAERVGQTGRRRPVRLGPGSLPTPPDLRPSRYRIHLRTGVHQRPDLRRHLGPVSAARRVRAEQDPRPLGERVRAISGQGPKRPHGFLVWPVLVQDERDVPGQPRDGEPVLVAAESTHASIVQIFERESSGAIAKACSRSPPRGRPAQRSDGHASRNCSHLPLTRFAGTATGQPAAMTGIAGRCATGRESPTMTATTVIQGSTGRAAPAGAP